MRMPNLLATRVGRLVAFFGLYITEGIPLGFAATAVATQLRRQDVGPAEIGAFVGSFYLPWAFKWAFGPFIDVFTSERLGRRRGWILGTQLMMIITLLACTGLNLPAQLCGHRGGRKAQRDALGDVEAEEGRQAPEARGEQVAELAHPQVSQLL